MKLNRHFLLLFRSLFLACIPASAGAASLTWTAGESGSFNDPNKYAGLVAPAPTGDSVAANGTFTISYSAGFSYNLTELFLNGSSGAGTFNLAGGDLVVGNLWLGRTSSDAGGASRVPHFNQSGGTATASAIGWGNGANGAGVRLSVSGGTFNFTGTSTSMGGSASGNSFLYVSSTGEFKADSATTFYLGNGGTGKGTISLSNTGSFSAPLATLVLGQSGNSGSLGTLTMADGSICTANLIVLGGNNATFATNGVINLNGGTISAGSIRKGSSSLAASSTQIVLRANGGTVKALTHANNANYFQGTFVDLQSGGLTFDTNSNEVSIANVLSGPGALTKSGEGVLNLTAVNTYTGNTTVNAGVLTIANACIDDATTVSIASGARLRLTHSGQDQVNKIVLNGTEYTAVGTYGSSSSGAIYQDDNFFEGTGVLRIGPASLGRDLVWTGAYSTYWEANGSIFGEYNFLDGANPADFIYNDNVTFDDSSTVTSVVLNGLIYPGDVTFNGTQDYMVQSFTSPSGLGGTTSITVNNTATVSLGGADSSFTGPINVNAGVLKPLNNKSFGASSGITIANGARVDLNGKAPGSIYTYTLNGPGPSGGAAIINSGVDVFSATGIKNLILTADSTIGNDGGRFDIGHQGTITGNGFTLTKIGNNPMAVRGDASGSVIHYVIQGGHAWAESSANAFGGSSGSVLVKSGAAVGHFGSAMTIPTPVSIESGGILRSGTFGAATALTGTWSGSITLAGNVTLDAVGGPIALTGSISGTANITKTGGNPVSIASPTYVGNTTINSGTLTLQSVGLSDSSTVSIANSAILKLEPAASDTVDKLFINGAQVASGTWGSSASGATHQDDVHFQGVGTLNVLSDPPASGFLTWAGGYSLTGNDALASADPDNDGIDNAVEYVLGGNPTVSSQAGLPTSSAAGDNLVFTFSRSDGSETPDVSVSVDYGSDLTGWTSVPIGATSAGIVTVAENGADPDLITVTIPKNGDPAKFARLKVTVTAN